MSNTETYAEKMNRIAAELLDVLRDVLGPERRLPAPRSDYARYGDHSVTVRDGENGRVEVTAHLTTSGAIKEYSARRTHGDREPRMCTAVGPLRMDFSQAPEERPTILYVLPLIVRLDSAAERMKDARRVLAAAGHAVEDRGPTLVLRESHAPGSKVLATIEPDPDNGFPVVHGRDAGQVREILRQANVF
uniref:Uncharacterized protein n=1 Tax=Siphoviridae sp. ctq8D8 TaxID=2827944 RepID=A0A8S5SN11_9CAUD|nr:MAG TPA: hypothetical protein [Siphoviridae sp. ctq8D8]